MIIPRLPEFKFAAVDRAEEARYNEQGGFCPAQRQVSVVPFQHGCIVEVAGAEKSLVLCMEDGMLNMYVCESQSIPNHLVGIHPDQLASCSFHNLGVHLPASAG